MVTPALSPGSHPNPAPSQTDKDRGSYKPELLWPGQEEGNTTEPTDGEPNLPGT